MLSQQLILLRHLLQSLFIYPQRNLVVSLKTIHHKSHQQSHRISLLQIQKAFQHPSHRLNRFVDRVWNLPIFQRDVHQNSQVSNPLRFQLCDRLSFLKQCQLMNHKIILRVNHQSGRLYFHLRLHGQFQQSSHTLHRQIFLHLNPNVVLLLCRVITRLPIFLQLDHMLYCPKLLQRNRAVSPQVYLQSSQMLSQRINLLSPLL